MPPQQALSGLWARSSSGAKQGVLAAVLSGAGVALPLQGGPLPVLHGVFTALSGLTVTAAFIARFVAQKRPQSTLP
jgi:hypothetical protein